jgi:hypothetical protein
MDKGAPELPSEVVEHILDYLHDIDPQSLRQASQVARSWVWPARVHLFRHVHVKHGMKWDWLKEALRSLPGIAPLIQEFSVSDHKRFLFDAITRDEIICSSLTAVGELRVINTSSVSPLYEWLDVLAPNATRLLLEKVYFRNCSDFFHAISVRPYLREVKLLDVNVNYHIPGAILDAPRLEVLIIDSHVVHAIMKAGAPTLNMTPRKAVVQFMDEDTMPLLATLLRLIGSEIESFKMTVHEAIMAWQGSSASLFYTSLLKLA